MKKNILVLLCVGTLLGSGFSGSAFQAQASTTPQAKPVIFPKPKPKVPSGSQTYTITSPADVLPRIIQATIDPPDVHVGMTQHLSLVVQDPGEITSVEAQIETDHGTVNLPLKLVGPVAQAELAPQHYYVDGNRHLAFGDPEKTGPGTVAFAADGPKLKYTADWIVRDTHDTKYHTTFLVKDSAGRKNSITLAWSDACSIPVGGAWNIANFGACAISATDGVDNGGVTIATYTLAVNSPAVFAWNSGQSITVSSGGIAIATGASLKQTNLWMIDSDNDGYPDNSTMYAQDSTPASGRRRYTVTSATPDCSPGNASTWQTLTGYTDADGDGYGDTGPYSVCSGASLPAGYYASANDCNGANGYVFQTWGISDYTRDDDRDGYSNSGSYYPSSQCVGGYTTVYDSGAGYVNVYRDTSGSYTWIPQSQLIGSNDCNDNTSSVYQNVSGLTLDRDKDDVSNSTYFDSNTVCVGGSYYANGHYYYNDVNGSSWTSNGSVAWGDCNDTNANVFQQQTVCTDYNQNQICMEGFTFNACVGSSGGYGLGWWMGDTGHYCWLPSYRVNGYNEGTGDNAGGQYCYLIP